MEGPYRGNHWKSGGSIPTPVLAGSGSAGMVSALSGTPLSVGDSTTPAWQSVICNFDYGLFKNCTKMSGFSLFAVRIVQISIGQTVFFIYRGKVHAQASQSAQILYSNVRPSFFSAFRHQHPGPVPE